MEVSGRLYAPVTLNLGSSRYALNRMLGGPQGRCRFLGEEEHLLPLQGIKPRFVGRAAHSLVTASPELSWLRSRVLNLRSVIAGGGDEKRIWNNSSKN
jgi:hypothetical protein